uniref:ATP synthase F0 subunit 8 n=1 Tax=Tessaromerus quadriarticulatus TaxID=3020145 RepID=UPI00241191E9|nr:ATP synthase F0 subunit 8 [Tessaromerus quadriarticulatus]WEM32421.1 ATP synthase F0 subunit 8 [Tessaromerus quadriarticulatus]
MPQMMPLWWETLMMFFIMIMSMFYINLYHNKNIKNKLMNFQKMNNEKNWKW